MPLGQRPRDIHTKHLTELERFRVRTLYYDACMTKRRIQEITGYSDSQIRTAIRAKSAAIPPRTGRPRKGYSAAGATHEADLDRSPSQAFMHGESSFISSSRDISELPSPRLLHGLSNNEQSIATTSSSSLLPITQQDAQPGYPGFSHLPLALRVRIWKLVLTRAPPQSPFSTTWWFNALPQSPWLVAGVFPDNMKENWELYLEHRQYPTRLLSHTNHEARQVVFDTFTPVCSDIGIKTLGSTVKFIWVDRDHDKIYCKDHARLPELFGKARTAVLPILSTDSEVVTQEEGGEAEEGQEGEEGGEEGEEGDEGEDEDEEESNESH
ncbi:hypothetical protein F4779DRAFT_619180 [Xylariaceae sp. FL0662B]|nr:hypothetical protein F4779DRAFT_619180 [Xylariaceae sp. FL0662B]